LRADDRSDCRPRGSLTRVSYYFIHLIRSLPPLRISSANTFVLHPRLFYSLSPLHYVFLSPTPPLPPSTLSSTYPSLLPTPLAFLLSLLVVSSPLPRRTHVHCRTPLFLSPHPLPSSPSSLPSLLPLAPPVLDILALSSTNRSLAYAPIL